MRIHTQEQVFNTVASNFVDRFIDGYNVTILAYGQTSSGKTYTMGTAIDNQSNSEQEGIIPRAMSTLFQKLYGIQNDTLPKTILPKHSISNLTSTSSGLRAPRKSYSTNLKLRPASMTTSPIRRGSNPKITTTNEKSTRYTVLVSFIEIYNEELIDLLNPAPPTERTPVTIREDPKGHIIWTGLKEVSVSSTEDVLKYLQMGTENRATGSTDMNAKSSRSHAIFSVSLKQEKWVSSGQRRNSSSVVKPIATIGHRHSALNIKASVDQMEKQSKDEDSEEHGEWMVINSKFHFVDLAGSERLKRTAAEGDRRKEGININAGLLALGNVISALSDPSKKPTHIPYRDSKLTRLLQDSLGGNSTTLMIACVSSAEINLTETINTIKYAHRARNIRNKSERNEAEEWMTNDNVDHLRHIISKLKAEVKSLKYHHRNTPSPLSSSTSGSPTRTINFTNHTPNAFVSPSSSTTDIDHRPFTCPSTSATTNITVPESVISCEYFESAHQSDNRLIVADLRRQIEELQNEVTVTRERNLLVEKELKKKQKSLDTVEFEHLVEPVIKEYETSISKLESQLAIARAALLHSDQALAEQQAKIAEYETLQADEIRALAELKEKLALALEREQTSENYCLELEARLEKSINSGQKDQLLLADLHDKVTQFINLDGHAEQCMNDLEIRLSVSENERSQLKKNLLSAQCNADQYLNEKDSIEQTLINKQLAVSMPNAHEKQRMQPQNNVCEHLLMDEKLIQSQDMEKTSTTIEVRDPNNRPHLHFNHLNVKNIAELIASLDDKQAKIELLESSLEEIEKLKKELSDLRQIHAKEIDGMEKALIQLKEQCSEYRLKLFIEQQQSEVLKETIEELSKSAESHSLEMKFAQEEYESLKEQLRQQECNSHVALRQRLEELEKLKLDHQALQLVEEKQDAIIQGLEFKLGEMDHLISSLRIQLGKSNMSVERLQADNAEKTRIAADMQNQLNEMLKDISGMGMEKKQLERIMCFMEGTLQIQEEKSEETIQKLEDIKQQYKIREEEIEEKRCTLSLLSAEKEALSQTLKQVTHRVSEGDEITNSLVIELEETKNKLSEQIKKNSLLEERAVQRDVELQHIQALKDRIHELELEIDSNKATEAKRKIELDQLESKLQNQLVQNETLIKTIAELEASINVEHTLASAQDVSGMVSELEDKLKKAQQAKKREDDLWKAQMEQLREELYLTRKENQQKNHIIDALETSLHEARQQFSRTLECQESKEGNRDNIEKALVGHEDEPEKLKSNQKHNYSNEPIPANIPQEELLQRITQLQEDNIQLVKLNESLELQLALQRSQLTLETKNLELELMKLAAANDRLEKEMEQMIPRNNAAAESSTSPNRESGQFTSPSQTPRITSLSPSISTSSSTGQYRLQRDISISSIAKTSKSGSHRSVSNILADSIAEDEAKRMSSISSRSEVGSPRLSSSLRSSRTIVPSASLPPLTAPPSNPLPPIPTPLSPTPVLSPSSPSFGSALMNEPVSLSIQVCNSASSPTSLHQQDSMAFPSLNEATSTSDSSNFTLEQYEKLVRSLQRKAQLAENDIKAHQEVITKLETQLTRSESSIKEAKKQLDTVNREKQACDVEIQNLREQITQIQSEQKIFSGESLEDRKQLEKELEDEKKKKEAAEKARKILENRMHALMNRKSKFMCF
ncbi:hypothetical protein G6F46_001498 [Rhizopus delemar]|uniref:Kinesin motor domain-containing protein n=2 Tax=Rhizopus TaxID=4842 RepID=A0A9P6ZBA0_9FUNG|nr:hypothetical protein G6F53_001197 [Rhizopus delemar]KAG1543097.1 hypothetical protein G6F51_006877 [Rhizopus arrhizus]KAG1562038.1 hypothetical protein G6F49_001275 [Rhizopus delemar]KAG1574689.1 hypothetical protein G6F50_001754 [Rhizopus delemar]KAG1621598.1 hypothetical protein G6F46_001498 [Rhizopus delemar]